MVVVGEHKNLGHVQWLGTRDSPSLCRLFDYFRIIRVITKMIRLPLRSTRSSLARSITSSSHRSTKMSTKAYILPIDPKSPSSQSVPNLDPAKLWSTVPWGKKAPKVGTTRVFYNSPSGESNVTALVSLGDEFDAKKGDAKREVVRKAVGSAVKDVKSLVEGETTVSIDASADPHAAGMSNTLSWRDSSLITFQCSRRCTSRSLQIHSQDRPPISVQSQSQGSYP